MFEFFRRYQRAFIMAITVMVVISFSFFGTYQTLQGPQVEERVAFQAVDGENVSNLELEEALLFFGSDSEDKILFGGAWGPNFLNDGILRKEIFQTGIAEILATQYAGEIEEDLKQRHAKEKKYSLYAHPEAGFVSTETVWSYYAPALKENFDALKMAADPLAPKTFASRVNLYLGERQFPASLLRRALQYQQSQYAWLAPDPYLNRADMSLYGYHTPEDWFGPRFMRIAVEFILNGAKVAKQQGYKVSKAEALADLLHNAEMSFEQLSQNQHRTLDVATSQEYFNEQLRRMHLDQSEAVKIWQQALLFRRLFQDVGNSVFVDRTTIGTFMNYATEAAKGTLYELPQQLQLGNFSDLQKFELYLRAVAKKSDSKSLILPQEFASVSEVSKKTPELVQKRYLLKIAKVDKNQLIPKVTVKETWNWEIAPGNWAALKKEFPELGIKQSGSVSDRMAALDRLDAKTRASVDSYARKAIVDAQPELLFKALAEAEPTTSVVSITLKGPGTPFIGVTEGQTLITLLDQAPLKAESESPPQSAANSDPLAHFSADGRHYYKIEVLARGENEEILTYAEANRKGALEALLNKELESFYAKEKSKNAERFQKKDGQWKEFGDVKDQVAELYFADTLKAIRTSQGQESDLTNNVAASLRFQQHLETMRKQLQENLAAAEEKHILVPKDASSDGKLLAREPLADQWKLHKSSFTIQRSQKNEKVNAAAALLLPNGAWSEVYALPNGELYFYHKSEVAQSDVKSPTIEKIGMMRSLFSEKIQQSLASQLIALYKEVGAISIDYYNQTSRVTADE